MKEGDQEEIPLIPPSADLPPGMVNFVTEIGYAQLLAERDQMIHERDNTSISDENENRIAVNLINAKLQLLLDRISSAKIVNLAKQPKNIVKFGAEVYFTVDSDPKVQHYQIVGVDEANVTERKIAFTSPIAKIFIDRKVGDRVTLKLGKAEKQFEIVSIKY